MAVKIRMMRLGRRHRPFFRINAVDGRTPRDGRILEKLGHYDPIEKDAAKQVVINLERVKHWLDLGAVPSDSVSDILLRHGLKTKHGQEKTARREKAKSIARAKGKLFDKAEKIAAAKATDAEAAAKAAEEAAAKAAKEAAAKAAEEAAAAKAAEAKAAEEAAAAKAAESKAAEEAAADKGDEEAKTEG
ncbi:MAG: 30S ribosomal protein S16 [Planctomycetes bacterium]|nr:30S ribosomal protein S16 [Planctomycetota bacterium]